MVATLLIYSGWLKASLDFEQYLVALYNSSKPWADIGQEILSWFLFIPKINRRSICLISHFTAVLLLGRAVKYIAFPLVKIFIVESMKNLFYRRNMGGGENCFKPQNDFPPHLLAFFYSLTWASQPWLNAVTSWMHVMIPVGLINIAAMPSFVGACSPSALTLNVALVLSPR